MNKIHALVALVFVIMACDNESAQKESHDHPAQAEVMDQNNFETGKIQQSWFEKSFRVMGKVEAPPQNVARIFPQINGFVEEVFVIKGEAVKAGQKLAVLQHPDILKHKQAYLQSKSRYERALASYSRRKDLFAKKAISENEWERTQDSYRSAQSKLMEQRQLLTSMGVAWRELTSENLDGRLRITSPVEGYIKKAHADQGTFVGTTQPLFHIVNNHHLHLELEIPATHLRKIAVNQKVRFSTNTGLKELSGHIYQVNQVASDNGFFTAHAHFDEQLQRINPGSYVEGSVIYFADSLYTLPLTALSRDGNQVYSPEADGFATLPVQIIHRNNERVAVRPDQQLLNRSIIMTGARYLGEQVASGHSH